MEFIGRWPTDAELQDMCAPYSKNEGETWTLAFVAECVTEGAQAAMSDIGIRSTFERGLAMLKMPQPDVSQGGV